MNEVKVIELNPFMVTTDAGLFSWEHERELLERGSDSPGNEELIFRVVEKERSGSTAMLDSHMRQLLKSADI